MTSAMQEMLIDPAEMQDTARRFLTEKVDRRAPWEGKGGTAEALEAELSALGWYQLAAPEASGGLGQRFDVLAPIYEELGRSLAPSWLSTTMAAVDGLDAVGGDNAAGVIAGVIDQSWRIAPIILPKGQGLDGASLPAVPGAVGATHLLVVDPAGGSAWLIASSAPGVAINRVETWDFGRSYGEVALTGVTQVMYRFASDLLLPALQAHAELALAWDSVGAATQSLTETVDYMLGRQQFGRPIASFQALKHRAADHKVAIELARSLSTQASNVFAVRGKGWAVLAAQARILACDAFAAMAEDSIQLFGGVGFTWEYNPHLFLKRALMNRIIGGSSDDLRDRIATDVCRQALASAH
ncbi:acyl-CoA dehydrogenase family protein [Sphingobium sp. R-21]|uniref:acyl-CoA dehydrogenase family protein n=1 Tax=Sphingobium sp. R-21 TaxID=3404056 RepID=UPI003CE9456E